MSRSYMTPLLHHDILGIQGWFSLFQELHTWQNISACSKCPQLPHSTQGTVHSRGRTAIVGLHARRRAEEPARTGRIHGRRHSAAQRQELRPLALGLQGPQDGLGDFALKCERSYSPRNAEPACDLAQIARHRCFAFRGGGGRRRVRGPADAAAQGRAPAITTHCHL